MLLEKALIVPRQWNAAEVEATRKANVTDPDSRIMKMQAGYVQGYNGQAVVTAEQMIVAAEITQQANDLQQLLPMLTQAQDNLQAIDHPQAMGTALADAGYCSEANLTKEVAAGPRHPWRKNSTHSLNS